MSLPSIMWLKGASSVAPAPSGQFNTSTAAISGASTYTFSGVSIGVADPTRIVVVAIGTTGGGFLTINSVTIGGITATQAKFVAGSAGTDIAAIYYANITTSTTATVIVAMSGSTSGMSIGSYSLYNLTSNTPFNTNGAVNNSVNHTFTTLNTPNNGFAIVVDCIETPESATSASGGTLEYSNTVDSGACCFGDMSSGIFKSNTTAQTGALFQINYPFNFSTGSIAAASWG